MVLPFEKEAIMKIELNEHNKGAVCEKILRSLPQWFGIESAILAHDQKCLEKEKDRTSTRSFSSVIRERRNFAYKSSTLKCQSDPSATC
jgi:hypothetical protein